MKTQTTQQNIPSGWQETNLGSVADLYQSQTISKEQMSPDGRYLVFGANGVIGKYDKFNHEDSEVIVTCRGASCGSVSMTPKQAWITGNAMVVKVNEVMIIKPYVYYFLKNSDLNSIISGGAQPQITRQPIFAYKILFPKSKTEQQKIAEILGAVGEDIAKTQEVIEVTEKLKSGLMQQLFTRGIGHTKFKKTKIGQIPEEWDFGGFENFVNPEDKNAIKPGPFGSALKKNFYVKKGYKIYGQEQVISGDAFYGDYYVNEEKYKELKNFQVNAGDILISLVGTIGKILIVPDNFEKGIINPRLLKITPDKTRADSEFIAHLLKSDFLIHQMIQKSHGGTMNILNKGMLMSVGFGMPPLREQKEIAEILSAVDEKISVNKKLKEKLTLLKKGLMQDLLSGKKRV